MAARWLPPEANLFRTSTGRPALSCTALAFSLSWDAGLAKAASVRRATPAWLACRHGCDRADFDRTNGWCLLAFGLAGAWLCCGAATADTSKYINYNMLCEG